MKMRFVWLALCVLLSVSGSFAKPQAEQAGGNPAASASPASSAKPTPLPVVPYEKLIAFLPTPPEGWTAEKPSGSLTDIEVFNLSTATQTYQKGDQENPPLVTITLIDAGGHKGYFDAITVMWKVNAQTPQGYDKTVEIDGMPGYEHYSLGALSGSLSVVVGGRYFIQIEVANQDPKEMREWLKKIDLKKLAELK